MAVSKFIIQRQAIIRLLRDTVDKQKENADKPGRKNMSKYKNDNRVLLFTEDLSDTEVIDLSGSKLVPRFSGPLRALKVIGDAYTLDILRRCDFTVGPTDRISPRYESWASCDAECGVSYVDRPSHHARGADVIGHGCGPACA